MKIALVVIGDGDVGKTKMEISLNGRIQGYTPTVFDNVINNPPQLHSRSRLILEENTEELHKMEHIVKQLKEAPSHNMVFKTCTGNIVKCRLIMLDEPSLHELPSFNSEIKHRREVRKFDKKEWKEQKRSSQKQLLSLCKKDAQRKAPIKYAENKNVGRQNYNFY